MHPLHPFGIVYSLIVHALSDGQAQAIFGHFTSMQIPVAETLPYESTQDRPLAHWFDSLQASEAKE
jgi:hypothetical protein